VAMAARQCHIVIAGNWKGLASVRRLEWVGDLPGFTNSPGVVGRLTDGLVTSEAAMLVQIDAPRHIIACNSAWEQQTGYAAEEACGRSPSILHGSHTEKGVVEEQWASPQRQERLLTMYNKNGRAFEQRVTSRVVHDANGTEYQLITSCRQRRVPSADAVRAATWPTHSRISVPSRPHLALSALLSLVVFLCAAVGNHAAETYSVPADLPKPVVQSCLAVCVAAVLVSFSSQASRGGVSSRWGRGKWVRVIAESQSTGCGIQ